jgi:hypothetical protein
MLRIFNKTNFWKIDFCASKKKRQKCSLFMVRQPKIQNLVKSWKKDLEKFRICFDGLLNGTNDLGIFDCNILRRENGTK